MAYTPPTTPNVTLDFKVKPYTPPTTPNVILNFGPQSGGGGSGGGSGTRQSDFFLVF